jgi:hypothetical protein
VLQSVGELAQFLSYLVSDCWAGAVFCDCRRRTLFAMAPNDLSWALLRQLRSSQPDSEKCVLLV